MSKLYKENGHLSEHGEAVTFPIKLALYKLLHQDADIKNLSEDELQTLGGVLKKIVADEISERIAFKKEVARKLAEMQDEQFYTFLKEKYGDNWRLVSLTGEELERCPRPSREDMEKALEEGRKAAQEYYNDIPPIRATDLRFKWGGHALL